MACSQAEVVGFHTSSFSMKFASVEILMKSRGVADDTTKKFTKFGNINNLKLMEYVWMVEAAGGLKLIVWWL